MKLPCVIALVVTFAKAAVAAEAHALVLYTEPPNTYVNSLEVVSLTPQSIAYSVAVLPNGQSQEIPRGGVVAIIDYPARTPGTVTEQQAAASLEKISALSQRHRECLAKLNTAAVKWNSALAYARQHPPTAAANPVTDSSAVDLEVEGVKFRHTVLNSFTGVEVRISHSDGVATLPAAKLTPAQVAALNATSTIVRIDPSKIVQQQPKDGSIPTGTEQTGNSSNASPPNDPEIARLRQIAAAAEASVKRLDAEQANVTNQLDSTPARARNSETYSRLNKRDTELFTERMQARAAYEQALQTLQSAERAARAKTLNATVDVYKATATLPANVTDWAALLNKWTDEVARQEAATRAAEAVALKEFEKAGNTPESLRLGQLRDAERNKLGIAEKTLAEVKRRADEAERMARSEKQRIEDEERKSMEATTFAKAEKEFRALPPVADAFVDPKLATVDAPPSFADTIEFINGHIGRRDAKMGFGERLQKVIYRDGMQASAFDPADLNPEVKYSKGAGPRSQNSVLLECRNKKPLIQYWLKGHSDSRMISSFEVVTGDDIDTEKMAKAISHLILMFGGKKEAF